MHVQYIVRLQCSICNLVNNKPRVVVTDFRLHHTYSIILWLHSLSGVVRRLLCNPSAFSPAIITTISGWGEQDVRISVSFTRYGIPRARVCTCDNEVGVAISIRDPYIFAVHEPVQTTRSLCSTGPLSGQ